MALKPALAASQDSAAVHSDLPERVRQRIQECFDAACAIDVLEGATGGDLYVFGGSVRRVLFHSTRSGDLDLMVPNADTRAFRALDALQVPFELNRQRHHRYHWNRQQIDMLQPLEFYRGFPDVDAALRYFDLRINALAFHLRSGKILDPFQVLSQRRIVDPGVNWVRWADMPPVELAVLAIRLVRIIHETPGLAVPPADADHLREEVVPKLRECDWSTVHQRFPLGKDVFLQFFETKVLSRARGTPR